MEKEYFLTDLETGYKYSVTKERHENYMKMWEEIKPKLKEGISIPILTGTGGSFENGEDLQKIFYNPPNTSV